MASRLAWCLVVALAGCTVGGVDQPIGQGGADAAPGDPGGGGGGGGGGDPAGVDAGPVDCAEPVASVPSGKHNAGKDCMQCHDGGGGAPFFSVGGTLYAGATGGAAVAGATIRVTDADGVDHELLTAANGNFWSEEDLAFPIAIHASRCPDAAAMAGAVDQAGGSCNQGGCHDADFRIHLP